MKVKVYYSIVVAEVIEIDDKFVKLTDAGGYDDLGIEEEDELVEEFQEEIENNLQLNKGRGVCFMDVQGVWTEDEGEILYEG